jgi:hypothetical protein
MIAQLAHSCSYSPDKVWIYKVTIRREKIGSVSGMDDDRGRLDSIVLPLAHKVVDLM